MTPKLAVKLSSPTWEVNFRASVEQIGRLRSIRAADWTERRSIRAGESAGEAVFWAFESGDVTMMIGHDEETWDLAVTVPVEAVDEIVRAAKDSV